MKTYIIIGLISFGRYLAQFFSEKSFNVIGIDSDVLVLIGRNEDLEKLKKLKST